MTTTMQKVLEKTFYIKCDGTIGKEVEPNHLTLAMTPDNTLMIKNLDVKEMAMETCVKAMLMAHTDFLTNYLIPKFTSELETKDEIGVVDRVSNLPGRGLKRQYPAGEEPVSNNIAPEVAIAAATSAGLATAAVTATATALAIKAAADLKK